MRGESLGTRLCEALMHTRPSHPHAHNMSTKFFTLKWYPILRPQLFVLFSQYKECEEVVVEHRAMKERERLKAEQEERERKAVTKVLKGEGEW